MDWFRQFRFRLSRLLNLPASQEDLADEIQSHIEIEIDENIERGMSPTEARRAARLKFGSIATAREESREAWGFVWLETLWRDVRLGARVLARRRGTTAFVCFLLGAGIGLNTMIFTIVNAAFIRGLPYEDGERILSLESRQTDSGRNLRTTSIPDFLDWRQQTRAFESLGAYTSTSFNLADDESAPQQVRGTAITFDGFEILRVDPLLGRGISEDDSEPNAEAVVVIGHAIWQERYGSQPDVIGKHLRIDEEETTIIGVMPPEVRFPNGTGLWIPLVTKGHSDRGDRGLGSRLTVYGRLAPNVSHSEAETEMGLIGQRLEAQYPDTNKDFGITVRTFNERDNRAMKTVFLAMLGAVWFVLLIACANVANIQLALAIDRSQEISIRTALGSGKFRIFRQLLVESLLLAAAGGVLGLLFSQMGVHYFNVATANMRPQWIDYSFDTSVFLYLMTICISASVLFGLAPYLHVVKRNLSAGLNEGRGQTTGNKVRGFSSSMVAGQVALTIVLLVGAGLMMLSAWNGHTADLGAKTDGVLSASINLKAARYAEPEQRFRFHRRLLERIKALPGVTSVASASHEPGRGASRAAVTVDGTLEDNPNQRPREASIVVSPGFFNLFEVPVLEGRDFGPSDTPTSPKVAIVNRRFAEKYWQGENAIGKRIRVGDGSGDENPWLEVIGVASDVAKWAEFGFEPIIYRTFNQEASGRRRLLVRISGDTAAVVPLLRQTVADLDPNLPLYAVSLLDERLAAEKGAPLFAGLYALFAFTALVISAAGVFGLVAYSVRRRTSEFGIRMALGAAQYEILQLVLRQGMWHVAIGALVGIPSAYVAAQVIENRLVGVSATDPTVLASATVFVVFIAGLACWFPARRAASISPATTLRHE